MIAFALHYEWEGEPYPYVWGSELWDEEVEEAANRFGEGFIGIVNVPDNLDSSLLESIWSAQLDQYEDGKIGWVVRGLIREAFKLGFEHCKKGDSPLLGPPLFIPDDSPKD